MSFAFGHTDFRDLDRPDFKCLLAGAVVEGVRRFVGEVVPIVYNQGENSSIFEWRILVVKHFESWSFHG